MTESAIVTGTWPGGARWSVCHATRWRTFWYLEVWQKHCTAAGVVVLGRGGEGLPLVVMTRQQIGRNGMPPQWELPSGHVDPIDPALPSGERERPVATAHREGAEEVGVGLGRLTLYALRIIRNPRGGKYPRVSSMAYYVGYAGVLFPPSDPKHERRVMTLQELGNLVRGGEVAISEVLIIRAGVIAAGYTVQSVDAALGQLRNHTLF